MKSERITARCLAIAVSFARIDVTCMATGATSGVIAATRGETKIRGTG